MEPTNEQLLILEYNRNCVVIAAPGSGKTFVLSQKIKQNLKELENHNGIIAISYTNKASNELKSRSLSNGEDPKGSFFGTIDKFYLGEIIIPFGKQIFGFNSNDFKILRIKDLPVDEQNDFDWFKHDIQLSDIDTSEINTIKNYFLKGKIFIETSGIFANYVLQNSKACAKYLKARYKYLYIDEYQDSGKSQHNFFLRMCQLEIVCVAVGDLNQSIYAFSGKSSEHLDNLKTNPQFKCFTLSKNHRCHPSIINYSNYFLNPKTEEIPVEENGVVFFRVDGDESTIAKWIEKKLDEFIAAAAVTSKNQIAILVRGGRTGNIINQTLTIPHKYSITNNLDVNLNVWSGIFSNLLYFVFDDSIKFIEVVEPFKLYDSFTKNELKKLIKLREKLLTTFSNTNYDLSEVISLFRKIANLIAPNSKNQESIDLLEEVLNSELAIESYKPASENEINIMTLHKSKGLEFELVFHLDLYKWIIPNEYNKDPKQDINLHYVGLTRAKKACVLVSSTKRTKIDNGKPRTIDAVDSPFIWQNEIEKKRQFSYIVEL